MLIFAVVSFYLSEPSKQRLRLMWSHDVGGTPLVFASSDGEYLITNRHDGRFLHLFTRTSGAPLWIYHMKGGTIKHVVYGGEADTFPALVSPDAGRVVAADSGGKIYFFEGLNDLPRWVYRASGYVRWISASENMECFVAGSVAGTLPGPESEYGYLYLFEGTDNSPRWTYRDWGGWFFAGDISADGNRIVATRSYTLYLFSSSSNVPLSVYDTEVDGSGHWMEWVSISADGNWVVVGDADANVYLFNVAGDTLDLRWSYRAPILRNIARVVISADGVFLAANGDNWVGFFSNSSSTPLWTFRTDGHCGDISLSSDGRFLVFGDESGRVYLYDGLENTLTSIKVSRGFVGSAVIFPDDDYLAAGVWDNHVYLLKRESPTMLSNWFSLVMGTLLLLVLIALIGAKMKKASGATPRGLGMTTGCILVPPLS
jgi:WD40 repeat protein